MSFYEPQGWQAPARQPSWEQPPPPSRSGASSTSQREDGNAFAIQFEEVDRAIDNLIKSGKFYPPGPRRESMPMMAMGRGGGHAGEFGHRMHGGRHSVSDFDPSRGSVSNMQNFYANQRYQGRHGEPDQMMQAKRRMAAQRERELRNYHQEQQYNRSVVAEMASNQSDRSMSPSTLSEEGRRDLIARQHRALYGESSGMLSPSFGEEGQRDQAGNITGPIGAGPRGPSPRAQDSFGAPGQGVPGEAGQDQSRAEKTTSPPIQQPPGFGSFEGNTTTPPTGEDGPHSRQLSKSTTAPLTGGMAPIGSRPNPQNQPMNKRTTSPLPSTLSYGFNAGDQGNERSNSSNSNSNAPKEGSNNAGMGAWGTGSGVWGSNKIGATSVWG